MNIVTGFFRSSIGKKFIMAGTGLALFAFVVLHMVGNLQVFLGPEHINAYGAFLQSQPELIWPARLGLLALIGLHIWSAVKLSAENKAARPQPYGEQKLVAASYASRTMLMSGLIILCFVIYHLLHFTVQVQSINLTGQNFVSLHDAQGRHDVYRMIVTGFSNPLVSLFYIVGIVLLCTHLSHGLSSMFQSLGWKTKKHAPYIDGFARLFALVLVVGYCSIPVAVLAHIVK